MSWLHLVAIAALAPCAASAQSPSDASPESAPSSAPDGADAPAADARAAARSPSYTTVVTATRSESSLRSVSSTVTVIGAEELRDWQTVSAADALRNVPGLDVVRTGGPGSTTSLFTRGTNANHTLVLVDGVRIADPSSFDGAVDLADLGIDNVERIEVLRGPASSLYGSDALGGVVNILTRRGRGDPSASLTADGGSFGTYHLAGSASGAVGATSFALAASQLGTHGIPQAAGGTLDDPYDRTVVLGRVGERLGQALELRALGLYTRSQMHLADYKDGLPVGDPNYLQKTDALLVRPEVRLSLFGGRWRQSLGFSWGNHHRSADNPPNSAGDASTFKSRYEGSASSLAWQHEVVVDDHNQAMLLAEGRWERADTSYAASFDAPLAAELEPTDMRTLAVGVQDRQELLGFLTLTGSARLDDSSLSGSAATYGVGAAAVVPGAQTVVRVSHGTGFKAPSLSQLKDPYFGNADLQPERSRSYEGGVEQPWAAAGLTLGATFFLNDVRQLIDIGPDFRSANVASARIAGAETYADGAWGLGRAGQLRTRLSYTWMQPRDLQHGRDLLRRPRHKAVLTGTWSPTERASLTARVGLVGARIDADYRPQSALPDGSTPTVSLGAYALVSVMGRYELFHGVGLFARVENLTDARYQEVFGYGTPGLSAFGGLRVDL